MSFLILALTLIGLILGVVQLVRARRSFLLPVIAGLAAATFFLGFTGAFPGAALTIGAINKYPMHLDAIDSFKEAASFLSLTWIAFMATAVQVVFASIVWTITINTESSKE